MTVQKGTSYYRLLGAIHDNFRPSLYVEVGFKRGRSALLAHPATDVIAIDPRPIIEEPLRENVVVEVCTSDEFFSGSGQPGRLTDRIVDLAFIDGMHHWEVVLRDFHHIERYCRGRSIVLLHDCLPRQQQDTSRMPTGDCWTGDVWKAVLWLLEERTDLCVRVSRVGPTGLAIVGGFSNHEPPDEYQAPTRQSMDALTWDDYESRLATGDHLVGATFGAVEHLFPLGAH